MKKACTFLILLIGLLATLAATRPSVTKKISQPILTHIRLEFDRFSQSTTQLRAALNQPSLLFARQTLLQCRLQYKRIEFFLEYFFRSSALIYNHPAKYEVEEPFMEFEAPRGFQTIEALLFEKDPSAVKATLLEQATALDESAHGLDALLYDFSPEDPQLLESLRIELIRIMTLGITGYDAPLLKSGIDESFEAMRSIQIALQPFLQTKTPAADSVALYIDRSLSLLRANKDFDHFDRMAFLTRAALPLQYHLGILIGQDAPVLNTVPALNYTAPNLFAKNALNPDAFPSPTTANAVTDPALIALGRRLFSETALSANGSRSCATCHQPARYFTDGLARSIALDNQHTTKRNAPSLFYAAFQYSQFWDGRARTLEEQIADVLTNPIEMNADTLHLSLSMHQVARAIAAYIRTLAPMNSPFDRYIAGDRTAMNTDQIRGFNLFMGKAQCGTCHFAPLFNGLTPPLYGTTEYENLGLSANDDLRRPKPDSDSGRFASYPIRFYQHAFKTPSLRNCARTAPYMHNGNFHTLGTVMDFYNKGGGMGLGLDDPQQSLPGRPLHLSRKEIAQTIAFLHALTDSAATP